MLQQIKCPITKIENGENEGKKNSGDDVDPFRTRRKLFGKPSRHSPPALAKVEEEPLDASPEALTSRGCLADGRHSWDQDYSTFFGHILMLGKVTEIC